MSLVTPDDVRAFVPNGKTDAQLQDLLERIEDEIIGLYGAHYVDADTPISETVDGTNQRSVYLKRQIQSVVRVSEILYLGAEATTLTSADYFVWNKQGRLERLPALGAARQLGIGGWTWGQVVTVEYVPVDDSSKRKQVILELARVDLARTGLKSESIAGEYSYTASDTPDADRTRLLRRLGFPNV